MDLHAKRELNRGTNDALVRAFEFAVAIVVFALAGLALDQAIGTTPLFMALGAVLAVVGCFARLYYAYSADMDREQERLRSRGMGR